MGLSASSTAFCVPCTSYLTLATLLSLIHTSNRSVASHQVINTRQSLKIIFIPMFSITGQSNLIISNVPVPNNNLRWIASIVIGKFSFKTKVLADPVDLHLPNGPVFILMHVLKKAPCLHKLTFVKSYNGRYRCNVPGLPSCAEVCCSTEQGSELPKTTHNFALLWTCRQIYNSAMPLLFRLNTFSLISSRAYIFWATDTAKLFCLSLTSLQSASLRKIHIHIFLSADLASESHSARRLLDSTEEASLFEDSYIFGDWTEMVEGNTNWGFRGLA